MGQELIARLAFMGTWAMGEGSLGRLSMDSKGQWCSRDPDRVIKLLREPRVFTMCMVTNAWSEKTLKAPGYVGMESTD